MLRDSKSSFHWWFKCSLEFKESSPTLVLHMTTSTWFDREAIPFIYYFLELVILQVATKGLFSTLDTTLAANGELALVEIYELGEGGTPTHKFPSFFWPLPTTIVDCAMISVEWMKKITMLEEMENMVCKFSFKTHGIPSNIDFTIHLHIGKF